MPGPSPRQMAYGKGARLSSFSADEPRKAMTRG